MLEPKIHIIGVGSDGLNGLTGKPRELLQSAELILGSESTLAVVSELPAQRLPIGANLHEVVQTLETNLGKKRMVVVAGGDPLFYGVARYLCDKLGEDRFEVWPHVSSMQLAFARIKESWEEAYLTNLATHSLESVLDRIRTVDTVGIFTSDEEDPPTIAKQLLARGIDYFRAFVCENLGAPDERVTQGELAEIQDMEFDALNVMILKRKPGRPDLQRTPTQFRRFGNPDDVFIQSRPKSGLITQAEVRAIVLAQLDVQPGSVVWDIGAGSGSVAIEAAQLASGGMVYAIEQDVADYHLIVANAQTFGVKNITAIHGTAPGVFAGLPAPDAIFVGGIRHEATRLLESAFNALRPGGRLVVNVASLEGLGSVYAALKQIAPPVHGMLVNIARGTEQLETLRFEALNPTFLLMVTKPIAKM
ncbi:MAG: precorrin-6y C5,15-methyltransferase (decarboxylating) subunit CbiE [Planctomycetes bacterium]|nr:precorrin-6y C5,15-methyltransferase (decarboxylating) subunit CbiE [Planctomycetota bacterium]